MTRCELLGMAIGAVFVVAATAYLVWVQIHPDRF